jgi:hypothetical protein
LSLAFVFFLGSWLTGVDHLSIIHEERIKGENYFPLFNGASALLHGASPMDGVKSFRAQGSGATGQVLLYLYKQPVSA